MAMVAVGLDQYSNTRRYFNRDTYAGLTRKENGWEKMEITLVASRRWVKENNKTRPPKEEGRFCLVCGVLISIRVPRLNRV